MVPLTVNVKMSLFCGGYKTGCFCRYFTTIFTTSIEIYIGQIHRLFAWLAHLFGNFNSIFLDYLNKAIKVRLTRTIKRNSPFKKQIFRTLFVCNFIRSLSKFYKVEKLYFSIYYYFNANLWFYQYNTFYCWQLLHAE